jgi:hypothetical protein
VGKKEQCEEGVDFVEATRSGQAAEMGDRYSVLGFGLNGGRQPWLWVCGGGPLRPALLSREAFWSPSTLLYFWGTKKAKLKMDQRLGLRFERDRSATVSFLDPFWDIGLPLEIAL